jgi:type VI secretion system secreted protein Hcp
MALAGGGTGDVFLKVKGAKRGLIKGESQDDSHKDEIDVVAWSWGMDSKRDLAGGSKPVGVATIHELRVVKRVDSASTALMSALRTNESIKEAVLTLRKAGKTPHEYFKIKIEDGRVTALNIEGGDRSGSPDALENVSFTFNKIAVEYTGQGQDGRPLGAMTFEDQSIAPKE